jgi:hypothetical protein
MIDVYLSLNTEPTAWVDSPSVRFLFQILCLGDREKRGEPRDRANKEVLGTPVITTNENPV